MLTSPGPHVTLMLTSSGPHVILDWQAVSIYMNGFGTADREAAKLMTEIHMNGRDGTMVKSLYLGHNPLGTFASRAASEWIRSSTCMLSSLDLSFTRLTTDDWEQLTAAMNENTSLTFLDMRQWPAAADSVLGELGSCLLDESRPFALRFVRSCSGSHNEYVYVYVYEYALLQWLTQ